MATVSSARIQMLDIVRGLSMFCICGGEAILMALAFSFPECPFLKELPAQLGHPAWEGFTFYDVIFPTFLLVSGAAFTYSWAAQKARGVGAAARWQRLLLRTLILCLLGFIYNANLTRVSIDEMRFGSVLARIGLGVLLAAVPYALMPAKWRWVLFPVGLAAYAGLFYVCGGATPYAQEANWAVAVDGWLLPGVTDQGVATGVKYASAGLDAEGVVSTFGAMWTAYLGMLLGDLLQSKLRLKALWMVVAGGLLIGAAVGMEPWIPVVKRLWTVSYSCLAGGWTLLACGVVYLLADVLKGAKAFYFFSVIGVNALWFYFLPLFVNYRGAANFLTGGLLNRLDLEKNVHYALLNLIIAFALMWLSIWWLRRKIAAAAKA